jgi:homogentisate solanesyltransferase
LRLQVPFSWNPVVCFIAAFMTVFASVIAVTKDLPDVAGDAAYKVDVRNAVTPRGGAAQ